jgi:hypothetical protein
MKRMSSGRLEKASDTLKKNHRRFMESRSFRLFLVKREWPSLVGDMLARESYPADFSGENADCPGDQFRLDAAAHDAPFPYSAAPFGK